MHFNFQNTGESRAIVRYAENEGIQLRRSLRDCIASTAKIAGLTILLMSMIQDEQPNSKPQQKEFLRDGNYQIRGASCLNSVLNGLLGQLLLLQTSLNFYTIERLTWTIVAVTNFRLSIRP